MDHSLYHEKNTYESLYEPSSPATECSGCMQDCTGIWGACMTQSMPQEPPSCAQTGWLRRPQMITGSWDDITLVCGNTNNEPVNMVLQEGPASLFYACPKYRRENRSEGERACNNRLSIDNFLKALERMLQGLSSCINMRYLYNRFAQHLHS